VVSVLGKLHLDPLAAAAPADTTVSGEIREFVEVL